MPDKNLKVKVLFDGEKCLILKSDLAPTNVHTTSPSLDVQQDPYRTLVQSLVRSVFEAALGWKL
jgi:hypothetical protein